MELLLHLVHVVSDGQDVGMELATGYGKGATIALGLLDSCCCACTWMPADSATERPCVFSPSHFTVDANEHPSMFFCSVAIY